MKGADGAAALKGMVLLDEIRGRLAEVFSAKSYKIDHVLHGAIGSAATYGVRCKKRLGIMSRCIKTNSNDLLRRL